METKDLITHHIYNCPIEAVVDIMGGKWKTVIVHHLLRSGTLRFGELTRLMPGITQKILTKQLRELEANGIIERKVYPVVPPKVEYSLTELGTSLKDIVDGMQKWGEAYTRRFSEH